MERVQSNDPADLHHYYWNQRQQEQQKYLSMLGGSWSQPYWNGWVPMPNSLPSKPYGNFQNRMTPDFFQRYAQDGDSGFFHKGYKEGKCFGGTMPLNTLDQSTEVEYSTPIESIIQTQRPLQSSTVLDVEDLEEQVVDNPEPEQHALHVPPYSQMLKQGLGHVQDEKNVLHEEPFKIPEYKGLLHKKGRF